MVETTTQSSGFFDKFSEITSRHISKAWFFVACCLSIVVWAFTGPMFQFNETWQLVINTGTTIITFLLVALIQNSQDRSVRAMTHKLDCIMEAIARDLEQNEDHNDEYVANLKKQAGVEMEASQ